MSRVHSSVGKYARALIRSGLSASSATAPRRAALAAALIAIVVPAARAQAEQPADPPTPQTALAALAAAEQALDGAEEGGSPPDATVALNALSAGLPALEGAQRRRARGLLARPTDGGADQFGNGYPAGASVRSAQSAHFCVFWVDAAGFEDAPELADGDADGTPDYVEAVLEIAEFSYSVEVAPGALGWAPPNPDAEGCGDDPSARADVYLKQLGTAGVFGYQAPDPGQGAARSQHGYLVIDDDYAPAEYGFADPLDAARVTFAHEFNHLLQSNYDSFQDVWMFEATATWSEDLVYPEVNDYVNYVRVFAAIPGAPITDRTAGDKLRMYGASVWNHWLSGAGGGYGVGAVRRAWEVSDVANPADFAIASYDRAIRNSGGKGFGREFVRFAAATAEWRSGFGGFPDAALYPDIRRKGALRPDRRRRFELDHTAYRLLPVRAGGRSPIRLSLDAEPGVRAGVALVARNGSPLSGSVVAKRRYLPRGGSGSVTLSSPRRFERITAVVVNADGRVRGFAGRDWVYAKDGREFRAGLGRVN